MPKIEALVCNTGNVFVCLFVFCFFFFCLRDLLFLHHRIIALLNSECV